MASQTREHVSARQLFVMDERSLEDLHTLATRLGINYSLAVRDALHLAAERLRRIDQEQLREPVSNKPVQGDN